MKNMFQTVLVLLLLTVLVACPPITENTPPPAPLTTAVGTNVGSPVTQAISATGGTPNI